MKLENYSIEIINRVLFFIGEILSEILGGVLKKTGIL